MNRNAEGPNTPGIDQHTTPARQNTSNVPVDHLGHSFESPDPQPMLRRSTRKRFESKHFWRLREGEGTTDGGIGDTQTCETAKAVLTGVFEGKPDAEVPPDDDDSSTPFD